MEWIPWLLLATMAAVGVIVVSALIVEMLDVAPIQGWVDSDTIYFPDPVWIAKWLVRHLVSLGSHIDQRPPLPPDHLDR